MNNDQMPRAMQNQFCSLYSLIISTVNPYLWNAIYGMHSITASRGMIAAMKLIWIYALTNDTVNIPRRSLGIRYYTKHTFWRHDTMLNNRAISNKLQNEPFSTHTQYRAFQEWLTCSRNQISIFLCVCCKWLLFTLLLLNRNAKLSY